VSATEAAPVLAVGCLAARAHLLARMGRHEEAAQAVAQQMALADRIDEPGLAATTAHDAGLVALAGGRFAEAADFLDIALSGDAKISRPAASLARAESLVRSGDPVAAAAQLRAAVLEPVSRADQPWSLVPRMAGVQALIAAANGETGLALIRFDEAADGWQRVLPAARNAMADGYIASIVDLGRPPVVGLIEPARELDIIERDRAALVGHSTSQPVR
jgi:hypothetical protein